MNVGAGLVSARGRGAPDELLPYNARKPSERSEADGGAAGRSLC